MKLRLGYVTWLTTLLIAALQLGACSATTAPAQAATPNTQNQIVTQTGVITAHGAQIEAWWRLKTQEGQLWRLEAVSPEVKAIFAQLQRQTVRVEGTIVMRMAAQDGLPVLSVTRISLAAKDH